MVRENNLPLCLEQTKAKDCLEELSLKKSGCILVVNSENQLLGIFTDGDLRRALQRHREKVLEMPLGEIMTRSPRVIDENALAFQALQEMESVPGKPVTVLPVVREGKAVGLVRLHDLVQAGI